MRGGAGPRPYALSVYPRCPRDTANASDMYAANDCCTVERVPWYARNAYGQIKRRDQSILPG